MNDLRRTFAVTGEFHNDVSFHIVVTVGARMPAESDAVGHAVAIPVERYIRKFRATEVGRWAGHGWRGRNLGSLLLPMLRCNQVPPSVLIP